MTNQIAGTLATPSQPTTVWSQHYSPLQNATLSTRIAALPIVTLLGCSSKPVGPPTPGRRR